MLMLILFTKQYEATTRSTAAGCITGLHPLLMHADAILVNQTTARTVWLLAV
jgi:hypothetical protein